MLERSRSDCEYSDLFRLEKETICHVFFGRETKIMCTFDCIFMRKTCLLQTLRFSVLVIVLFILG